MGKLHELLAVEGDLDGTFKKIIEETTNTFAKKPALFFGFHKKLEMFDENASKAPDEMQELAETVHDKLDYTAEHIIRYIDAICQKDKTNQVATADLTVDGVVIGKNLPATFLLGLENKLKLIRKIYAAIPTLPPGQKWDKSTTRGAHVFEMTHPEEKFKTAKAFKHQVLYEATEHHPAQIEKWEETENVGRYVTNRWSGMISPAQKSALIGRLDKLIRATKKARQRANTAEVVETYIGKELFTYIHEG